MFLFIYYPTSLRISLHNVVGAPAPHIMPPLASVTGAPSSIAPIHMPKANKTLAEILGPSSEATED